MRHRPKLRERGHPVRVEIHSRLVAQYAVNFRIVKFTSKFRIVQLRNKCGVVKGSNHLGIAEYPEEIVNLADYFRSVYSAGTQFRIAQQ
jgi:hypothetical protein